MNAPHLVALVRAGARFDRSTEPARQLLPAGFLSRQVGNRGASHPLLTFFTAAANGRFPPVDGRVTVLPPLPGGLECSVAFTGHAVIATAMTMGSEVLLRPERG